MKKLFYLFLVLPFLFVACSDDDDNGDGGNGGGQEVVIKPSEVLTGGLPKSVTGMAMTYNADGWLTSMIGQGEKVTFTYGENVKTKATLDYPTDVIMKYEDGYDKYTIYMALGSNGFVSNCIQVYEDSNSKDQDIDLWSFKYNSDGQMTEMKRSEGGNEVTTMAYKDGNIVAVKMVSSEDDGSFNGTISYTSGTHKDGIENKGCIMLFDETFGIDLDEMGYAYYAGLLGKGTKKLPLKLEEVEKEDGKEYKTTYIYDWTLNEQGLPTKMEEEEIGELYKDIYEFKW